jgi:hypothetical protein
LEGKKEMMMISTVVWWGEQSRQKESDMRRRECRTKWSIWYVALLVSLDSRNTIVVAFVNLMFAVATCSEKRLAEFRRGPCDISACQARSKIDPGKSSKNFELDNIANCTVAPTTTTAMALVKTNPDAYIIKPEASAPAIDTSDWPLLLKNYSDCMPQLSHSFAQPS